MRRWKPQFAIGRWVAVPLLLIILVGIAALGAAIARSFAGPPPSWQISPTLYVRALALLGLLVFAGVLIYRIVSALTLRYELDRNGLYITWLGNRAVVPLDQVQNVDIGVTGAGLPWRVLQGIGVYWGQGRTSDDRRLHLFSTRPPSRSLVIYTAGEAYAIAPADLDTFVQDLEQRRNLGATKSLASTVEPSRIFLYVFWSDRIVRTLLIAAVALNLLMLALLAARYAALGPSVEMRFDAAGQVAELWPRHQVLFLPLAAFGMILLNTVLGLAFYRRQQLGARLLQGASVLVQLLFGIAVATIVT